MLKKKVGPLFIVGYENETPSSDFLSFVEEWKIGGVIVFARNIKDPEKLPENLKKISEAAGHEIFTAIDQEGGLVMRILSKGSLFPSAMCLANTNDVDLTKNIYEAIGTEMLSLGLNFNLAPVVDINHPDNPGIGARSFGESAAVVSKFSTSAIKGLQSSGVLSCAKHFPGKGCAKVDSHLTLPVISQSKEELLKHDIIPFTSAIANNVDSIMTSHVFFPALEANLNLPATLSKSVLTNFLREELKFNGLIITDDLEMGAIIESYSIPEAADLAFHAGSDLLLICHTLEKQRLAAEMLLHKMKTNSRTGYRMLESHARINEARIKIANQSQKNNINDLRIKHSSLIEEAHEKGITLRIFKEEMLPLKTSDEILFCCPKISMLVQVEEEQNESYLETVLLNSFSNSTLVIYDPKDSFDSLISSISKAQSSKKHTKIVFFTYNAHLFKEQLNCARHFAQREKYFGLVALRNPYDIENFTDLSFVAATYSFRTPALKALIKKLCQS